MPRRRDRTQAASRKSTSAAHRDALVPRSWALESWRILLTGGQLVLKTRGGESHGVRVVYPPLMESKPIEWSDPLGRRCERRRRLRIKTSVLRNMEGESDKCPSPPRKRCVP